jgi:holo-[acyl-carrier protein] synthase
MPIVGHGIDIVDVQRLRRLIERHGERFLGRCFTADEVAYARRRPQRFAEHLAARFAAKEAVMKVLGTGLRHGIGWCDIEVVRLPSGQPTLRLEGQALEIARQRGIARWHLSLSHVTSHATASAIGLREESAGISALGNPHEPQ